MGTVRESTDVVRQAGLWGLLVLMALPAPALAQAVDLDELELGLRAGLNRSEFWNHTGVFGELWEPRVRWHGGGVVRVPVKERVVVQAELLYTRKGAEHPTRERELADDRTDVIPGARLSTSYLELPVLLAVPTIALAADRHLEVVAGGTVAVLLDCRYSQAGMLSGDRYEDDWPEWECSDPPLSGLRGQVAWERVQSLDWGAILGLSLPLPVEAVKANLDLRYQLGLRNVEEGTDHRHELWQAAVTLLW